MRRARWKRKNAGDEQAHRLFVHAGVVRIGAAGIEGPAVPTPDPSDRRSAFPHDDCNGQPRCKIAFACTSISARYALLRAALAVRATFPGGPQGRTEDPPAAQNLPERCRRPKPSPFGGSRHLRSKCRMRERLPLSPQGSSLHRGMDMQRGPPRPRLSSALGMVWTRMPASSRERLVT